MLNKWKRSSRETKALIELAPIQAQTSFGKGSRRRRIIVPGSKPKNLRINISAGYSSGS